MSHVFIPKRNLTLEWETKKRRLESLVIDAAWKFIAQIETAKMNDVDRPLYAAVLSLREHLGNVP